MNDVPDILHAGASLKQRRARPQGAGIDREFQCISEYLKFSGAPVHDAEKVNFSTLISNQAAGIAIALDRFPLEAVTLKGLV